MRSFTTEKGDHMKLIKPFLMLVLALGLSNCSSQKPAAHEAQLKPSQEAVVAQRQAEINNLEQRLNAKRDITHSNKFQSKNEADRKFLNDQYAKLGTAKRQLEELKATKPTDQFEAKCAQLDSTLASLSANVELRTAE